MRLRSTALMIIGLSEKRKFEEKIMDKVTQIVNSRIKSYVTLALVNKLREIWDNPHFLLNAVVVLKTDEQRQRLLDMIEDENITDRSRITALAWDIKDGLL